LAEVPALWMPMTLPIEQMLPARMAAALLAEDEA
jgi:hypothetical protein